MKKRVIRLSVVPGDPTDGTGRVCIHLFVRDQHGTFVEPHVMCVAPADDKTNSGESPSGRIVTKPTRGRLACDRKLTVKPVTKNGVTTVVHRSDDVRAVSCPKCKATEEYAEGMRVLGLLSGSGG